MLPPHPQMYRKNIIQAIKMRPSALFLFCRGEPNYALIRSYGTEPSSPIHVPSCVGLRPLEPLAAHSHDTAPEPCRPICVPSRIRHPKLATLSAYPRAYGSDACYPICVPSRVRHPKLVALSAYPRAYDTRTLPPYLRTLAHTVRTLPPLAAYLYTGFYTSYLSFLRTFLIIYLYLLYKSFKGFI